MHMLTNVHTSPAVKISAKQYLEDASGSLWAWQRESLIAWRANGCRGIVEAVTGAGKTRVALVPIAEVLAIGGCVLVLVPTVELMKQWVNQLEGAIPRARVRGLGAGRTTRDDADVIVAVINSAASRSQDGWFHDWSNFRPSLLVADECHRYATQTFSQALDDSFDLRLGLTATLERPDGNEARYVVPYFQTVVYQLGYKRAIADGVVAPWKIVRVAVELESREAAKYRRHNLERQDAAAALERIWGISRLDPKFFARISAVTASASSSAARKAARIYIGAFSAQRQVTAATGEKLDAFGKLLLTLKLGQSALVFTSTKQSAEEAGKRALNAQLMASVVHSGIGNSDRAEALADFEEGEVQLLLAPRVLDEGIDVPDCGVAFILGMGSSPRQLKQRLGRVIRRTLTKEFAAIYYIYARGTHEDPTNHWVGQQWAEVVANALEVRDLTIEQLRSA